MWIDETGATVALVGTVLIFFGGIVWSAVGSSVMKLVRRPKDGSQ